MAIKVNGTVVVDDSRQLTNIASLDATTVAAFSAAGVGGSEITYPADTNITKGQFISITGDSEATLSRPIFRKPDASDYELFYTSGGVGASLSYPELGLFGMFGTRNYNAAGQKAIKFYKANDDGTITEGGTFDVGVYTPGAYAYSFIAQHDDAGNWCYAICGYDGSGNKYRIGTFNLDSSYNVINHHSSLIYSNGSDMSFSIAAYDTNKFCVFSGDGSPSYKGIRYQTLTKNGGSHTLRFSGVLGGSTQQSASVHKSQGFTHPYIPTNKALLCACVASGDSYWGSTSGNSTIATMVTFTNDSPSVSTKISHTPSNHGGLANTFNTSAYDNNPMSKSGYVMSGNTISGNAASVFKKASPTSDTLTHVRLYQNTTLNRSAYWTSDNDTAVWVNSGFIYRYQVETGDLILSEPTAENVNLNNYNNQDTHGYLKDNIVRNSYFAGVTKTIGYFDLGSVGGLFGIANTTASQGSDVVIATVGDVVDGFSGLNTGSSYGLGIANGSLVERGNPVVGAAVSPTSLLITANTK